MSRLPAARLRALNDARVRGGGDFVLYWMTATRRTSWSFALDRAVDWAVELRRPLVILEALRCDYPYASDRLHRFILEGMSDNARDLERAPVTYYAYVEPARGAGKGLLRALGEHACVVVTDDFPTFMLPRMTAAAAAQVPVHMEAVDSNGLVPMSAAGRVFSAAHAFRRFLHRSLLSAPAAMPRRAPLSRSRLPPLHALPRAVTARWPPIARDLLAKPDSLLAELPVDHGVPPVARRGGARAAAAALRRFVDERLDAYAASRNHPDDDATSGLSPYLHFGHVAAHEIFDAVVRREEGSPIALRPEHAGARAGFWGLSESAEAFLDQLLTWRELGFNLCRHVPEHRAYESLPQWARETLARHAGDPRPQRYPPARLEQAATADRVWNAAQRQLVTEGRIHNYLRMLWGKKVLEWTARPRDALEILVHLNDRWAVDGRDPNSYTGISWCLGRYDRPWGPERPIFGTVRYMSSASTVRKLRIRRYLERYAPAGG